MKPLPTPLNNNVLVEILDEYEGLYRDDSGESIQKGKVISVNIFRYHLTASSAMEIDSDGIFRGVKDWGKIGRVVYWQEFADSGQKFEHEGKKYALVPWWRLTAVEKDSHGKK